jgi:hypothetical protein
MAVRASMNQLISRVRLLIGDPAGTSQQFLDNDIQDTLDESRDDLRYEGEIIAPSIVNNALTNNQAQTIFADYYSKFQWWEQDVVLQGYSGGAAWVVVTPVASDYLVGHWQFETNVFTSGTSVPGQLPPVFATGKVYDPYRAAADMLQMWAAQLAGAYDITANGQSLRRSQLMTAKITLEAYYRSKAKPRIAKLVRNDVMPDIGTRRMRLLDNQDIAKGA